MNKDRFEKDFKDVFGNPVKKLKPREKPKTVTGTTFPGSKYPHGDKNGRG